MTVAAHQHAGHRRAMMAKVHLAKKGLGLDDETYRAMVRRVTGRASSADCTKAQLALLLDEFQRLGWKGAKGGPTKRTGSAPFLCGADHPSAKKARALWISLYQLGVVRDPGERALEAFAARQLRCERLQWADQGQVYKLIEALKAMAERAGWSQDVAGVDPTARTTFLKRGLLAAINTRIGVWPTPKCASAALDTAIELAAAELRRRAGEEQP